MRLVLSAVRSSDNAFVSHPIGISDEEIPCSLSQACIELSRSLRTYVEESFILSAKGVVEATLNSGPLIMTGTLNGYLVDVAP